VSLLPSSAKSGVFFRPERAAGRSRTRGCGLVQLGLKIASLLLHFVSKSVETLTFFQIPAHEVPELIGERLADHFAV
jgi:hypothetical protein